MNFPRTNLSLLLIFFIYSFLAQAVDFKTEVRCRRVILDIGGGQAIPTSLKVGDPISIILPDGKTEKEEKKEVIFLGIELGANGEKNYLFVSTDRKTFYFVDKYSLTFRTPGGELAAPESKDVFVKVDEQVDRTCASHALTSCILHEQLRSGKISLEQLILEKKRLLPYAIREIPLNSKQINELSRIAKEEDFPLEWLRSDNPEHLMKFEEALRSGKSAYMGYNGQDVKLSIFRVSRNGEETKTASYIFVPAEKGEELGHAVHVIAVFDHEKWGKTLLLKDSARGDYVLWSWDNLLISPTSDPTRIAIPWEIKLLRKSSPKELVDRLPSPSKKSLDDYRSGTLDELFSKSEIGSNVLLEYLPEPGKAPVVISGETLGPADKSGVLRIIDETTGKIVALRRSDLIQEIYLNINGPTKKKVAMIKSFAAIIEEGRYRAVRSGNNLFDAEPFLKLEFSGTSTTLDPSKLQGKNLVVKLKGGMRFKDVNSSVHVGLPKTVTTDKLDFGGAMLKPEQIESILVIDKEAYKGPRNTVGQIIKSFPTGKPPRAEWIEAAELVPRTDSFASYIAKEAKIGDRFALTNQPLDLSIPPQSHFGTILDIQKDTVTYIREPDATMEFIPVKDLYHSLYVSPAKKPWNKFEISKVDGKPLNVPPEVEKASSENKILLTIPHPYTEKKYYGDYQIKTREEGPLS